MRRQYFRRFLFCTRRKRPDRGEGLVLSSVLGIGLALMLICSVNQRVMPIYASMATSKVTNAVTRILEQTINDYMIGQDISYYDMVNLDRDENGAVTALTSNMIRLNTMRNGLLVEISRAVDIMDAKELSIPIGNLTGISFLSGRGFCLPVQILSVGSAHAAFYHSFTAAGINQTHHQILLDVTVTVKILLPGQTIATEVKSQVCAAETVIVGEVPNTYVQLEPQLP